MRAHAIADGAVGSLGRPLRIADLEDQAEGSHAIRVTLERAGYAVLSRNVRARVEGATFVTVLMTRDCRDMVCSDPATSCLGGRCEPVECTEEHPELCLSPECASAADCTASVLSCVATTCTARGTCFDAPDDSRYASGELCSTRSGCTMPESLYFDVVLGLEANLVASSGSGTASMQPHADGWRYEYDPTTSFMGYGPLDAGRLDASTYRAMEMARTTGWYASAGLQIGGRGTIDVGSWSVPGAGDDAVVILPENSVQPIVTWEAAVAGHATIDLAVHLGANAGDDVEAHLIVTHAGVPTEIAHDYVSADGAPDDSGVATGAVSAEAPLHLTSSEDLAAGDAVRLYVRVGDHDGNDVAVVRGGIGFVSTP